MARKTRGRFWPRLLIFLFGVLPGVGLVAVGVLAPKFEARGNARDYALVQPIPGGVLTTGTIVSYHQMCSDPGPGCEDQPTIRFTDLQGRVQTVTTAYEDQELTNGTPVRLSYDPRNPAYAHNLSAVYEHHHVSAALRVVSIVVGCFLVLIFGSVLALTGLGRSRRAAG